MSDKYNTQSGPTFSSIPSSVADIIELNRRAARATLDASVLKIKRNVVDAIGVRDVGSITLGISMVLSQAAMILMEQLTKDPRVRGELSSNVDASLQFKLSWDLTQPKPPEAL
jgi:hypothetical protein